MPCIWAIHDLHHPPQAKRHAEGRFHAQYPLARVHARLANVLACEACTALQVARSAWQLSEMLERRYSADLQHLKAGEARKADLPD